MTASSDLAPKRVYGHRGAVPQAQYEQEACVPFDLGRRQVAQVDLAIGVAKTTAHGFRLSLRDRGVHSTANGGSGRNGIVTAARLPSSKPRTGA